MYAVAQAETEIGNCSGIHMVESGNSETVGRNGDTASRLFWQVEQQAP